MDHTESVARKTTGASRRWPWVVLVLATVVAFLPTIDSTYLADDYRLFTRPIDAGYRTLLRTHQHYVRPLPALMMRGEFLIWGTWTFGPHVTNLLMHVLTTLLVGALARRLTGDRAVAFCSAALFGLHPIHAGAVSWLSARFDLCFALLGLSAVLKFDDFLLSGSRRALALSLIAFAGALLSKESAVAILPLLLLWAYMRSAPGRSMPWRPLLPFGLTLLLYGCLRMAVTDGPAPLGKADLTSGEWLWNAIFVPVRLLALPLDEGQWATWAHPLSTALLCLLAVTLASSAASAIAAGRRRPSPAALFGLGLLLVTIVPLAPVVHRLEHGVAPTRVLYMTSVGFCMLVGAWIGRRRPAVRTPLLLGWMLLYGAGAVGNNLAWRRAAVLADLVPRQIQELVSARTDSYQAIFIQDPPHYHNGAYVYLGADLGLALDLVLERNVAIIVTSMRTSSRTIDLRMPRRPEAWLGFRWDPDTERMIDITPRLRAAMTAYRDVEREPMAWRGKELRAWAAGGRSAVNDEGLTAQSEGRPILLQSPTLPISTGALEVRASVRRLRKAEHSPRLVVRWTGTSRVTEIPALIFDLQEGKPESFMIPAPTAARVEDLEEEELRALLTVPPTGYELHIESIQLLPLVRVDKKRARPASADR